MEGVSALSKLTHLRLLQNNFSETFLQIHLSSVSTLELLSLQRNKFLASPLPSSLIGLSRLTPSDLTLEKLSLGSNSLSELMLYNFASNALTGTIQRLSCMSNFQIWSLRSNRLSATTPDLSGLTLLQNVSLPDNPGLSGPFPDFSPDCPLAALDIHATSIASLTELKVISAFGNKLGGPRDSIVPLVKPYVAAVGCQRIRRGNSFWIFLG